jgi:hypothetical protein
VGNVPLMVNAETITRWNELQLRDLLKKWVGQLVDDGDVESNASAHLNHPLHGSSTWSAAGFNPTAHHADAPQGYPPERLRCDLRGRIGESQPLTHSCVN